MTLVQNSYVASAQQIANERILRKKRPSGIIKVQGKTRKIKKNLAPIPEKPMYIKNQNSQLQFSDFQQPIGFKMNPQNRWIKKTETIPWAEIEDRYSKLFPSGERKSCKTENGVRFIIDTETIWIFRSGTGRANHRKPVLPVLRGAAGISNGSAICTVITG